MKFLKLSRLAFGSFIEFGCADGVRDSNTHMLECMGWKGFCIEPVETVRERQHAYAGAVCPPNQTSVDIVVASLNGLHGANPDLKSAGQTAKHIQKTKCYNLNDVRRQHHMDHVTYMTVDTEGNEPEILLAYSPLDWVDWLQVECNTGKACRRVHSILKTNFTFKAHFTFRNGRGGGDMLYYRKQ